MNDSEKKKREFLEKIADCIPRLFDAIEQGNERSEYILGNRTIAQRQVRLLLSVEVVDPGANPLATHSQNQDLKTIEVVDTD